MSHSKGFTVREEGAANMLDVSLRKSRVLEASQVMCARALVFCSLGIFTGMPRFGSVSVGSEEIRFGFCHKTKAVVTLRPGKEFLFLQAFD